MKSILRTLATLVATVAVVGGVTVGAGASVAAKTVSDSSYAKTLCSSLSTLDKEEQKFYFAYDNLGELNPAPFKTGTIAAITDYVGSIKAAQARLAKLTPEDGGKKVTKGLDSFFSDALAHLQSGIDKFQATNPPSGPVFTDDFSADVAAFEASLNTLKATLKDPIRSITNQDLLHALKDAKACKGVLPGSAPTGRPPNEDTEES